MFYFVFCSWLSLKKNKNKNKNKKINKNNSIYDNECYSFVRYI